MALQGTRRPLVIAHRGYREKYPENTLAAFNAAVDAGAPMIELDVSLTKDRQLIVIHDDTLDRTTDGTGPVSARTLSELRCLDAGGWFDARFSGEKLPGLEETLAAMAGRTLINIEIKSSAFERKRLPDAVETQIVDLIHSKNCRDTVLVSSFNTAIIENTRQLDARLKLAVISREVPDEKMRERYRKLGLFSWHPEQHMVTRQLVDMMHKDKIRVFPYTVNAIEDADRLLQTGVDGMFSDDPVLMMQYLAERERG